MNNYYFILNEQNEPEEVSFLDWMAWDSKRDRQVALWESKDRDVFVSTVFLGINHSLWPFEGPPLLWETMIFGGPHDQYQKRYSSHQVALNGHTEAVKLALTPLEETNDQNNG